MRAPEVGSAATRAQSVIDGGGAAESSRVETWLIAGPELMFGCLSLGLAAVVVGWTLAGARRFGVAGSALLLAGAVTVPMLEPTAVALAVMALSATALWCEAKLLPAVGLYAAAGWLGLVVAGLSLFGTGAGAHPAAVLGFATAACLGTYVAGRRAWRRVEHDPLASSPLVVGRRTTILRTEYLDDHRGMAIMSGELWSVHDPRHHLVEGDVVTVIDVTADGLIVSPDRTG